MQDCFAYRRKGCSALKIKKCDGCSFYKTKEQYLRDQKKALDRIYTLDEEKQRHIFETYYGGK
jgi:hypothetical protein